MGRGDRRSRPDHYALRARKEGFAARSIYKLQEIQRKYAVIPVGGRVLDIGAAPGSWTQFARSVVGPAGHVVAVDLSPLPDLEGFDNVVPIVGDIYAIQYGPMAMPTSHGSTIDAETHISPAEAAAGAGA